MSQLPRRIALINQKGGVGKTTTAVNLGAALAESGRRVVMGDMDPQSHLTMHLGLEPGDIAPSLYDVLTDNCPVAEAVHPTGRERLRILPATIDLAAAEVELVGVVGREVILRDAVNAAEADLGYDYLLLDCPPSLGLLTLNALAVAHEVFICLQPHFLALQGVGKLLETVALVRQRINPTLRVTGVVLCMYETGTRLAGEVTDDLADFLSQQRGGDAPWADARIFNTIIRRNIKLAECPSFGQVIFQYAPSSHGALDYQALAGEVREMETRPSEPGTSADAPAEPAAPRSDEPSPPPGEAAMPVDSPEGEGSPPVRELGPPPAVPGDSESTEAPDPQDRTAATDAPPPPDEPIPEPGGLKIDQPAPPADTQQSHADAPPDGADQPNRHEPSPAAEPPTPAEPHRDGSA